jgi:hypothetical protein
MCKGKEDMPASRVPPEHLLSPVFWGAEWKEVLCFQGEAGTLFPYLLRRTIDDAAIVT